MTKGLIRYQQCGCFHFITFSCHRRLPYLATDAARNLFERSLETMRLRYDFVACGYVVMPEQVHLLVSEPTWAAFKSRNPLATEMKVLLFLADLEQKFSEQLECNIGTGGD